MKKYSLKKILNDVKKGVRKNFQASLTIIGFFIFWQIIVVFFQIPQFILPSPLDALEHLFIPQESANYSWMLHISTTLYEIALSFIVTATVGILLAIVISWSRLIKDIMMPFFIFINSLPTIAIAPIILLWMGYGIKTNILIAFLVSFFPVVINTIAGLNSVEDDLLDLVRYLHGSKLQIFIKIRIPNSLPYIFSGLKIGSTMCIVGAIVGEFIASDKGLGYIIINSQFTMNTPPIFSALIVISIAGALLYGLVTLLEKLIMPWREIQTTNQ